MNLIRLQYYSFMKSHILKKIRNNQRCWKLCLSGCFMMLRNNCLKKIGLFDEDIFLYTEDIDLTRRMHKHFRTVYYPGASIYHVHERGSYHNPKTLIHIGSGNSWIILLFTMIRIIRRLTKVG